jgi:hypothetical protein
MIRRRFLASVVVLALAGGASAGQVLLTKDGKALAGKVVSLDDAGVVFAPDTGGEIRLGWDLVVPKSRYDLWSSTLAPDDAAGRVALGKWAFSADLFLFARRELVKAKGLGYAGPEKLDELIALLDKEEADAVLADVDALIAAADLDKALERVKSYLRTAQPGADAERVRARVDDLVKRIELREAQEKEAEEARKKAEKEGKLKDWIAKTLAEAKKKRDDGETKAVAGLAEAAKGAQTLARNALSSAETLLQDARAVYKRVKKAAGAGDVADQCDKDMRECDRRTVEVLARWGAMEVDNKSWKTASPIVDRGLKIDPTHRELLDLRKVIDESWIRRKMSDITNARGHESD